jgi:hypothetical protein
MEKKSKAKAAMLKELSKVMSSDMYSPLKEKKLQKVTVASDSAEGLKKGLSKAEQILSKKKEMFPELPEMEESEDEEESEDDSSEMEDECKDMSKEELQSKIEMLQKMLSSKE